MIGKHPRDTKIVTQMKKDTLELQRLSKIEQVKELQKMDHCFLSSEGVKEIGEPFGVYKVVKAMDNRSAFKGLNLGPNHKEGDITEGLDAAELAELLCKAEGIEYPHMWGRGSQLRVCCNALLKHLS